jgi:hypothetical protein
VALLEFFIKSAVTCKQVARSDLVRACAPFLRHLTHADLGEVLMPTLQRALLRSPETVLASITSILGTVALDLSQYVQPSDSSNITKNISSMK